MFLIDTNCWMQLARQRSEADQVRGLIAGVPRQSLLVTDFSVHSLGVIFIRFGMIADYEAFLNQASIGVEVRVVGVPLEKLARVVELCMQYKLNFDDAFHYAAAELHGLKLVSLDADFDRTPNGRLTPAAALQLFKDEQSQPMQDA